MQRGPHPRPAARIQRVVRVLPLAALPAFKAVIADGLSNCRHWFERAGAPADNVVDAPLAISERMIRASMASAFPGISN